MVDGFQIINLVTLVDDLVEEEASEAALQQYALIESFADYHARKVEIHPEVLWIFVGREYVRILLPIYLGLLE